MAGKKEFNSAAAAVKWWSDTLKNGLPNKSLENCLMRQLVEIASKRTPPSERVLNKFEKLLAVRLNARLKEFGLINLYTEKLPQGLLAKCASDAGIYVGFDNPFPENIKMQVTTDSVIVKTKTERQIVYNKTVQLEKQ